MKRYRSDGWNDPEEENLTVFVQLGPKVFQCPSCKSNWRVDPVISSNGRYWGYEGKCEHCKTTWVNQYHAFRAPKEGDEIKQVRSPYNDDPD